jgi:hypothetical protein
MVMATRKDADSPDNRDQSVTAGTDGRAEPRYEEPDFDDEDEAAMDRVYARLDAGETLDDIAEIDEEEAA